ncbi:ead/Ea22-like family protein [Escherichia albertii]|uniref:ead/Ea22-like family protein n=1 Tax=Escherichia albertii TaxID=208962 RepID=UPI000931E126|nr:ead/Ea22-like family protein [Escherichia albertii]HEB1163392.1 ead/Ea22-like family protein [Escherichia albertii]
MSNIDKRALRHSAESIIGILENIAGFEPSDIDGDSVELRFETEDGFDTGCDVSIVDQCQKTADVVRALLDELERNQQYIKRRDQENEDIALTVGKLRVELEAAENNLIDSECHVAELEEALHDKQALLEASEKRIAELEAELVSQTYKLNELSGNSPVTPDGWISCSDRMPSEEDVLVYCSDTKEQMVGFHKGKGLFQFFYMNGVEGVCEPSHWMPLPEPPL